MIDTEALRAIYDWEIDRLLHAEGDAVHSIPTLCDEVDRLRKGPWINPDDRLPEENQVVIIAIPGLVFTGICADGRWYGSAGGYNTGSAKAVAVDIIAWMPWPVPPKSRAGK